MEFAYHTVEGKAGGQWVRGISYPNQPGVPNLPPEPYFPAACSYSEGIERLLKEWARTPGPSRREHGIWR